MPAFGPNPWDRASGRLYIPTLDGWRTVAIGLVIGAHLAPVLERVGHPLTSLLVRFFGFGGYGVDVFFAISGYLIGTLLLTEKDRLGGRIDLGRFYTRRAFRILPPLVTYLAALLALRGAGEVAVSNFELLAALGFCRNYADGGWFTGHFWSLAIEEHFYLVIPVLLSTLRWRRALAVAAGLSVASVVWRALEFRYGIVQPWVPWTKPPFRTENRFDGLMNGAILALLLHRPSVRDRFAKALSPAVVAALLALAVVGLVALPSVPSRRTIAALVIPLVIASTVLRPGSWAGRLLEWPPLRWVGRLSYSLYLWQQLFLISAEQDLSPDPLGRLQRSFVSVVPALACAALSYHLIEKPMIRLGHRLAAAPGLPSRPTAPAPADGAEAAPDPVGEPSATAATGP